MVYAKQTRNDEIIAVFTYDYTPKFSNPEMQEITEDEYNEIVTAMQPPVPPPSESDEVQEVVENAEAAYVEGVNEV